MKAKYTLKVKNIQGIKEAIIYIDRMNGIVGDNNLGKSTINKILYCLVKAKVQMDNEDDSEYTGNVVERFFMDEEQKEKINKYINGNSEIKLNKKELDIIEDIRNLVGDLSSINKNTAFSTQVLMELTEPIIRYGTESGEIEFFKEEDLIYKVQFTKNKKLFKNNTIQTKNNLGITEECNRLKEMDYEDVTYIGLNDILALYPVWGDILIDGGIKSSTKDTVRKLMKCNNVRELEDGLIAYDKSLGLVYKAKEKFININSVGDGFKRLAQIKTLINNKIIKRKGLVLLEEPEVGIHSNKIKELVEILESLVKSGVDIVFTTHSSLFINYILEKSNIHLATSESEELFDAETIIQYTKDANEILAPYLKPLSELREAKFKSILERKVNKDEID
ncbi:MAG: ATP-binding protein [Clostridium sp.]|uniref:ATP-binding protein n=1 Tax=Clostridium sp. TaxID=1506 RepID=UPI003F3B4AFD